MKNCSVGKIGPDLFQFNEQNEYGPYVDAYMILGTKRAVIVDALQDAEDLYQRVRQITDLPFDLLLTHGHGDHAVIRRDDLRLCAVHRYREAGRCGHGEKIPCND